jgi:tRNA dimethylallyltransferase
LIDVSHPNDRYDLAKWLKDAKIAIGNIISYKKLPIIAGGTGLYVQSLIDGYKLSEASVDQNLREKLEELKVDELLKKLKSINAVLADKLNNSERNNKRRLIRHIEILTNTNQLNFATEQKEKISPYDHLIIGVTWPREDLKKRILKRIIDRLNNEDMLGEVKRLHSEHKVSWKRLESFGLEYKFLSRHLQNKIDYGDMIKRLHIATSQFAKKQMTWLRRWEKQGTKINWVNDFEEAEELTKVFLNR